MGRTCPGSVRLLVCSSFIKYRLHKTERGRYLQFNIVYYNYYNFDCIFTILKFVKVKFTKGMWF